MVRKCLAEFIGTFALVFAGTGAIVVDDLSGGVVTHVGVALTFGLIVMAMIYAVGDISGAHLNPAVSAGFWIAGRLPRAVTVAFMASQLIGAIAASLTLRALFQTHPDLGATRPAGSAAQSFGLEVVLTFFLMFVIIRVATGSKEQGLMAGAAIGATVGLEALFAGPISGASMNPARSLGPALVALDLRSLWIYLTAPFVGSALAVLAFWSLREPPAARIPVDIRPISGRSESVDS